MELILNTFKDIEEHLTPILEISIHDYSISDIIPTLSYCIKSKEHYDRALFVRLGCEAVGGDWKNTLEAMASVELMDYSVIVIDDILDKAPRRMGRATVYKKYRTDYAIISAAILKSISSIMLLKSTEINNLNASRTRKISSILEQAHSKLYFGQYLDVNYQNLPLSHMTEEMYLEMIKLTTGIQISSCCRIGAILGGGQERQIDRVGNYGLQMGMAYQVKDDLIDYINEETISHKTPFLDLKQKKRRLPLLYAYRIDPHTIDSILKKKIDHEEQEAILELIGSEDVIEPIRNLLSGFAAEALTDLDDWCSLNCSELLEKVVLLGTEI